MRTFRAHSTQVKTKRSSLQKRGLYVGRMYQHYRRQARMRGHKWRLTRNEFARIVARECVYCGAKPKRRFFTRKKARTESKERVNGVDRVANAKGYTPANSVACCTRCNSFKSDFELKEFLRHVTRIAKYTRRLR